MNLEHIGFTALRTIAMYFFILLTMRLMGKRELGHLSIFDLIVSLMIADLSSIVLESDRGLLEAILPIAVLALLQLILAYILLKFPGIRSFAEGEATVVIQNGQLCDKRMSKMRYNTDDLMMQLREKDIADVSEVECAVLETTGKLSVFPKAQVACKGLFRLPVPVIVEGVVQPKGLVKVGKSASWLRIELLRRGYNNFKDIYYASINSEGQLFLDPLDK